MSKDLLKGKDKRFADMLHEVNRKPNNLQFAVAQYSLGQLAQNKRSQLWHIPPGQGKTRIAHCIGTSALLLGITTHVRMLSANKTLLDRDEGQFSDYWSLITREDNKSYHTQLDIECSPTDLFIIDESDLLMFTESHMLRKIIASNRCICLTGTPDNKDDHGMEKRLVNKFNLAQFSSLTGRDKNAVVTDQL